MIDYKIKNLEALKNLMRQYQVDIDFDVTLFNFIFLDQQDCKKRPTSNIQVNVGPQAILDF